MISILIHQIRTLSHIVRARLYCCPVMCKSVNIPSIFALPIFPRSRKASKYKSASMGISRMSILRRSLFSLSLECDGAWIPFSMALVLGFSVSEWVGEDAIVIKTFSKKERTSRTLTFYHCEQNREVEMTSLLNSRCITWYLPSFPSFKRNGRSTDIWGNEVKAKDKSCRYRIRNCGTKLSSSNGHLLISEASRPSLT